MSIPQCLFIDAKENGYDDYDVPLPVRYVLEKGYKIIDNRVIVDVPYDNMLGAMVDDKYNEFDKKPGK